MSVCHLYVRRWIYGLSIHFWSTPLLFQNQLMYEKYSTMMKMHDIEILHAAPLDAFYFVIYKKFWGINYCWIKCMWININQVGVKVTSQSWDACGSPELRKPLWILPVLIYKAAGQPIVADRGRRLRWSIGIMLAVEIAPLFLFSSQEEPLWLMTPI